MCGGREVREALDSPPITVSNEQHSPCRDPAMSQSESSPSSIASPPVATQFDVSHLVERRGTVPFVGVNSAAAAEYPDDVSTAGDRFAPSNPKSFKEALEVLPHPGEGELWAENEFVAPGATDGTVDVDLDSIQSVHGLDTDEIEQVTGRTLNQLVAEADPSPLVSVGTHKDIIDRRRLALHTLGFDCKFRWQIASDRYDPGNMRAFFRRKIAAAQQHGAEDAFGWIRHRDWGGSVTMTTIYPSKAYEVGMPDETDLDLDGDEITIAEGVDEAVFNEREADADDGETLTIYYGDRMGYDFRGTQKLWAKPLIYIPSSNAMIPIPYAGNDLSRKHTGNLMEDAIEWHEKILSKLDELCESINQSIVRARVAALDFNELPFEVEDFYRLIGVKNDTYCEKAAERARSLATPSSRPTLWNLQLSLKLTVLEHYSGAKAGDTYQSYQEIAGEILRHPSTQVQLALEQYEYEREEDDEEVLDEAQQTLAGSLADVLDMKGVTENRLNATEAQKIEARVQQRLPGSND